MCVRTSVTIGSLQEIFHCESYGDLKNDLDLIFQGHLIEMGYNSVSMLVSTSVTMHIGSLQGSDLCESVGDLENDLDLVFQGHLKKQAITS